MRKTLSYFLLVTAVGLSSVALAEEVSLDELQAQIQAFMERISPPELSKDTAGEMKAGKVDVNLAAKAGSHDARLMQARLLLQQSSDDVTYLQTMSASQRLPDQYRESLAGSRALLRSLSFGDVTTEEEFLRLMAVSADLRTKAEHARQISTAAFKSVDVTVHTRKQGQEVSGYEVWYTPAAFRDGSHNLRFEKYSSPTANQLAPGNYYIWARNVNSGTEGNQSLFPIGQGKTYHDIDIDAP